MENTFQTTKRFEKSGLELSALGLGCWAIGGPFKMDGKDDGWGEVDDAESIRAIHRALDLGVTFFDTSDAYGTGHSESVLGQALHAARERVTIATKFGYTHDAALRELTGTNVTPAYIRQACEASLRRLNVEVIDLYQLHVGEISRAEAEDVAAALEDLRAAGRIRAYGWSTDSVECAGWFAPRPGNASIQLKLNLFHHNPAMLRLCEEHGLAAILREPLAMGFLTGKYTRDSVLPGNDVRGSGHTWVQYYQDGKPREELLARLEAVREILTADGRTLVQGALGWLWAQSPVTVPITGFKNVRQVEENAGALRFGPLSAHQVQEISALLA